MRVFKTPARELSRTLDDEQQHICRTTPIRHFCSKKTLNENINILKAMFLLGKSLFEKGLKDTETDVLQGNPGSAICVQKSDGSLKSAIHNAYRISLRPSSMREPRHPLLKVFLFHKFRRRRLHACSPAVLNQASQEHAQPTNSHLK